MAVTLPVDTYEIFEKAFGKEDAKTLVRTFETTISEATDHKWEVTKNELLEAMRKEFVTKELFEEKIENVKLTLDRKFTIMFLILLFTTIFLNQNALEFIAKVLGLVK